MAPIGADGLVAERRRHLAALTAALEAQGLGCRLLGADSSILGVVSQATGRRLMVLATVSGPGWSFLWGGGGLAAAEDPAAAAAQIAAALR
jgi:hypothetical protein